MKATWDIFCTVVDNYGDIGVTWRLARQLVDEHEIAVRLWVDDLNAFVPMCPGADAAALQQWQQGVDVRQWPAEWVPIEPADVVIGAFACQLPAHYVEAMRARAKPPLWLNLEYLSAEHWVEGCHGLPSPQANGLRKVFFFPGFTEKTGGLLREATLLARRQAFEQSAEARQAFLQRLGVYPEVQTRLISLFAYENTQLGNWLDALAADSQPTHLLVPQGRILADVGSWLGLVRLEVGDVRVRGALTVQILPFVSQDDYDRLLWSCDFNAVRGEDSFVRAQWAGRPMLWHIYVQDENAHWEKLEAFLEHYRHGLSADASAALVALWRAWNMDRDVGQAWQAAQQHWPELQQHARDWAARQATRPDLAMALVQFYRNWL
ncbi:elongation factor P maturation arginine rhamnosyltransferase EarP [Pseudomonas sp. SWRI59]|uniref:elongation factor P maturation arginine rhamnosyltransferase EarP n=1 Tax=Pseudomonas TaxID=286 RepID=UPI00164818E9|nr:MULTISPECIES: elongation factor P maturation arginine rhamnosyltransferase EarP [unclassified Pseudomonas]MBC3482438.1 elongation factor P maturation arginine rhamnosyltransferase EarP [Pseudomonas sp. SWRI77]MBC3500364.1 elongation factor P maturation arginine rhamnosyltransferase EarP [Pseudomonas sp. SWRI59]MBC3505693.1 elongation factor P maturation arginine rhamnosyltransferase EarP [Pseudomonas sp. SWRI68]